jgi:hypothetical protein
VQKIVQVKQTFHSDHLSQQTLYSLGVAGGQRALGKSDFPTETFLYSGNRSFFDTEQENALLTESLILVDSAQFIAVGGSLLHQFAAERNIQVSIRRSR